MITAILALGYVTMVMMLFTIVGALLWYSRGTTALAVWVLIAAVLAAFHCAIMLSGGYVVMAGLNFFKLTALFAFPMAFGVIQLDRRHRRLPALSPPEAAKVLYAWSLAAIPLGVAAFYAAHFGFAAIYRLTAA